MSYDSMFQKAVELQNAGALNQAEDIYLQLLQVMPENSDVWNLLGLAAQSKGNLVQAKDCFLNAIKYAPTPFFAHYFNLGLVYKSLNKPKEALDAIERSLQLKSDLKEGWNFLGILQTESGLNAEAVKSFCKALEIDNDYDEARANLCFYTNDLDAVIKLADEDKNNYTAQMLAAQSVKEFNRQIKYLENAAQASFERVEPLLKMAELYKTEKQFEKASLFYHKVLNLDSHNVEAILGLADICLFNGDLNSAEKFYLRSFDITREIAGAHVNYAILLYQQKRLSEALEEYRKAVQLDPYKPEISYNLALILKETGDYEEALGLMFNAHLADKENETFVINIAETLALLYQTNPETALKIAENWHKKEPDNVFFKHLSASLSGASETDDNLIYTQKLFDHFAQTYEDTLAHLNPTIIQRFSQSVHDLRGKILDLGCGTGLAGEYLKNENNTFDGVDISANMIELAKAKGIYDNLYQEDISVFLKHHPARHYDWILAMDVFCYMGDLKPLLEQIQKTKFCFSVESGDEERHQNFYLSPEGRYKHKKSYISNLLKQLNIKNAQIEELAIRQENGHDVKGLLVYSAV